jgi:lipoyl(octanoyl) transferase
MKMDHLDNDMPADCLQSGASPRHIGMLHRLGLIPYPVASDLQEHYRTERVASRIPDLLLLMEHPAVFTAGRTTREEHLLGGTAQAPSDDIPLVRTDRGGSVTYHGPGQLIGYPILKLGDYCAGPKAYVQGLEAVLISTLAAWDIVAYRRHGLPGVWAGANSLPLKVASIGVRIAHGITSHGFALNVSVDLAPFSSIVPCGIAACRVTSMAELLGTVPDIEGVTERVAMEFSNHFQIRWIERVGMDRPLPARCPVDSHRQEESPYA